MMRTGLHLVAGAVAVAAALPAFAQPAAELIPPPPPGVFDRPARDVSPPEDTGESGPIAAATGTGPAFVLPPDEPVHLGEIVVSVERARAQAAASAGPLVIAGSLYLVGHLRARLVAGTISDTDA